MKKSKLLITLGAMASGVASVVCPLILTGCSCHTGGGGGGGDTPVSGPIPESEFIVKNGILMGLKQKWSAYKGYTEIFIPKEIKSINTDALASKGKNGTIPSSITKLTFEESNNAAEPDALIINDRAFEGSTSLNTIVLPKRTQYIGVDAFAGCSNVETLDLSTWSDERSRDVNPFANAGIFTDWKTSGEVITNSEAVRDSLYYMLTPISGGLNKNWFHGINVESDEETDTDGVTISYDIVNDDYAVITSLSHDDATTLEKWTIPSQIETENGSFYVLGIAPFAAQNKFKGVKKILVDSNGYLYSIGARAFDNCSDIENIDLTFTGTYSEGKLEMIDSAAFANLPNVKEIKLPDSLKSIGSWCFEFDKALKNVSLDNSRMVQKLMPGTFYDCKSITYVNSVITSSVSWIGSYAFALSESTVGELTGITFKKACTYIGDNAFENRNINEVKLNENLEYLGDFAFINCSELKNVTFWSCLGYFGAGALSYTNISQGSIYCEEAPGKPKIYKSSGNLIATNDESQIVYCSDTWEVLESWKTKIKSFAPYAFAGAKTRGDKFDMSGFTNLASIGEWALAGIKTVNNESVEIDLPNSVTSIGDHAFSKSDVSIQLFNEITSLPNLTSWGEYLFSNCEKLETFDTSATPAVTKIPEGTFSQSSLKTLIIKKKVQYLGDQAFGGCTNLSNIDVSDFAIVPQTWYSEDEKPFDFTLTHNLTIKIKQLSMQNSWKELLLNLGIKLGDYQLVFKE